MKYHNTTSIFRIMNKICLVFSLSFFIMQLSAQDCPGKTRITADQLPLGAIDYLSQYEVKYIDNYDMYTTAEGPRYLIEFEDENPYFVNQEMMMIFDDQGNLLISESEEDVTGQTMPDALNNYMAKNLPAQVIRNIEVVPIWNGKMAYELKNEGSRDRMYFTMDGEMLCIEVRDK